MSLWPTIYWEKFFLAFVSASKLPLDVSRETSLSFGRGFSDILMLNIVRLKLCDFLKIMR